MPRDEPVSSRVLVVSVPVHELAAPINLQAAEDVLWVRYPAVVGRIAQICNMDIASPSSTAHPTLATCSAGSVSACSSAAAMGRRPVLGLGEESTTGAEKGAGGGRKGICLGNYLRIFVGMLLENGLQDGGEMVVLSETAWRRRDRRGRPDGETGERRR